MTQEQFAKYQYRHSEIMVFHQQHPRMDVDMMLLAVDFDNGVFRLASCDKQLCWIRGDDGECWFKSGLTDLNRLGYTHVRFRYGYTKRTMLYEIDSITVGRGNPNWGAPTDNDVFIIRFSRRTRNDIKRTD